MTSTASAPGKVIMCGEHAVVYGRPAVALPLIDVRATATVHDGTEQGIVCNAPDIGERWLLHERPDHPIPQLVQATLDRLGCNVPPSLRITLRSNIPVASGMGSGAALGAALVKALATHWGQTLRPAEVAALVYESERAYHGTPSGIDNTVVSYEQPIWFQRNAVGTPPTIEPLKLGSSLRFVIGDTGVRAPTYVTVGAVRAAWQHDRARYEGLFDQIGAIARDVRGALATGRIRILGRLLNRNQALLRELGVSSPELERLIDAALTAGAQGAKLSGGGGGGIMLALVDPQRAEAVSAALGAAGAVRVLQTVVLAGA
jgi:mevalonate kinase